MNTFFEMVHTPATMTFGERILLSCAASKVADGSIVEVGTLHGGSTRILRDAAPQTPVYTIDINRLRQDLIIRENEAVFFNGDARAFSKAHADMRIGMLFIDGDHSFPGALNDYQHLAPLVAQDGTICFHDTNHAHFGVHLLVDTLIRNGNLSEHVQIDEICAGRHAHARIPAAEVFVQTLLEHGEAHVPSVIFERSREMTYRNHRAQAYLSVLADFRSNGHELPANSKIIGKGSKGRFLQRYFNQPDAAVIDSHEAHDRDCHYYICSHEFPTIQQLLSSRGVPTRYIHVLDDYIYSRLVLDDITKNGGKVLLSFATSELERDILQMGLIDQPDHIKHMFHGNGFLHLVASRFWFDYTYV